MGEKPTWICTGVKGMEQQQHRINLDVPRYNQSEFSGRLRHFFGITDWRLCFKSDEELNQAKDLLDKYR